VPGYCGVEPLSTVAVSVCTVLDAAGPAGVTDKVVLTVVAATVIPLCVTEVRPVDLAVKLCVHGHGRCAVRVRIFGLSVSLSSRDTMCPGSVIS